MCLSNAFKCANTVVTSMDRQRVVSALWVAYGGLELAARVVRAVVQELNRPEQEMPLRTVLNGLLG